MSEKRTLSQSVSRSVSQWLRRQDVYEAAESEPVAKHWRESLLADFEALLGLFQLALQSRYLGVGGL